MTVLNAQERHLEAIAELERQCFSLPLTTEQLRRELPDDSHVFLVAEEDGRLLGYVGMQHVLDEGYISNVAVAPEYRRNGVAGALLTRLLSMASALDLSFVTLEVRAGNAPAIALYDRFGFVPVGRRKNYYSAPKEDAVLMTHYLK